MPDRMVQRPFNASATGGCNHGATPVQRPGNGGERHTPYPYGVAPALGGGATESEVVPMPRFWVGGPFGGRGFPLALTGQGVAA